MRMSFDQLVSAIPPELYFKTKATISQDIAVYNRRSSSSAKPSVWTTTISCCFSPRRR